MTIVNPNRSSPIIRFFAQTFNTTKASPPAVQETVHFKHLLRGTRYLDVSKWHERGKSSSIVHAVCLPTKRSAFWGLGLSFSILRSFNSQSEGFSQVCSIIWSDQKSNYLCILSNVMRTLIRNRHGRPLLSRISFTRALRKTRPCSASHHLSKNVQKMANDWFIIHQSLCENKRQKTPGWRGEWTESSNHFYGRFREFGGCRTRAVTGRMG